MFQGRNTGPVEDKQNTPFKTHLDFVLKLEPYTFAPC